MKPCSICGNKRTRIYPRKRNTSFSPNGLTAEEITALRKLGLCYDCCRKRESEIIIPRIKRNNLKRLEIKKMEQLPI